MRWLLIAERNRSTRPHGAAFLSAGLSLTLLAGAGRGAGAQVVTGHLFETGSKAPIALGTVALADTSFNLVAQTFTNERGAFQLRAPRAGAYFVLASRLGYRSVMDGILEFEEGGNIDIEFYLRPEPLILDSIVVEARRQRTVRFLEDQGFYERMSSGFGHFITPEDIERRMPVTMQDLLRAIPRVLTGTDGAGGTTIVFRGGREGTCTPRVFVDGVRAPLMADSPIVLEQVVHINDIKAVEVYLGPASTPLQWGGSDGACGVLLIWTEKGAPDRS